METPFIYGIATDKSHFTDREAETQRLTLNFENGINTIIISPRRWGKTSLVNHVVDNIGKRNNITIVRMDAFACRTPEDFYRLFAAEVIRQTYSRAEEWLEQAKRFLTSLTPVVSLSSDPINPVSLSFKAVDNNYGEEVLHLPERIASAKNTHIIVCIDEFQQIGEFPDSLVFQKKLRAVWQLQHNTSYCLYGSKKHMLVSMFQNRIYPFYRFGDVMFLERIPLAYWIDYITSKFNNSNKTISQEFVEEIYNYVDGNSSYIQQLAWIVWSKTQTEVTSEIMEASEHDLMAQNHSLFIEQTNNLTSYQIRMLNAIIAGKAHVLNRKETIDEFRLGSTSNVSIIKKALQKKEIIDISGKEITFADPLYARWLAKNAL